MSARTATNGNRRTIRKNEIRVLSELGEYLRRMHRDDQRLLLLIAEKMAGRGQGQTAASAQDLGDNLGRGHESGSGG